MNVKVVKESHRHEALEFGWQLLPLKGDYMYHAFQLECARACQEDCGMDVLVVAVNV